MTMANHDEAWLMAVDANLSQLDAPNNLAAQNLAGKTARTGVIEVVDEGDRAPHQDQQQQQASWEQQGSPSPNDRGRSSSSEHVSSIGNNGGVAIPEGTNDVQDDPKLSNLRKFLEHAALVSDLEDKKDDRSLDRVSLMTLHTSKGLEFNTVFVAGFEDGLCPFERRGEDDESRLPTDYEEEKRLAYVGATRAKEHLFFLSAQKRWKQDRLESRYTHMLRALGPGTLQFHLKGVKSAGKPSPHDGGIHATGGNVQSGESTSNNMTNSTETGRGGRRSASSSTNSSASNMTSSTRIRRGSSQSNGSRSTSRSYSSSASRSGGTASQTSGGRSVKPANGW
ncbi:P-loop containing nucleoside triphosphate hydrolase protein [Dunaliella salina]|uniref:P-loop containing nucleoside triphosphate hydrolase protein n=1 Tax=Dunaliella salina TaxID=3046 RepID=A0ABQ7GDS6_DUNSA|nr:P-loop containing nucleoside triphosphate hydrolase protein [Dunaliella salina]|eukprot:KAF5832760.1 P-loop containing nucleoside triphosphate hydrolase protein [Dunaliella salina]